MGNVFRRLGQEADLKDTLNRRRDQERSQQSTAQNGRQKAALKGQGEIPIEDLHRAITAMEENDKKLIATVTGSLFSREICEARLPEGFKLSTIKAYKGKSDPHDHLDHFNNLMELHLVFEMAKYIIFTVTLTKGAKKLLRAIPARSITSW